LCVYIDMLKNNNKTCRLYLMIPLFFNMQKWNIQFHVEQLSGVTQILKNILDVLFQKDKRSLLPPKKEKDCLVILHQIHKICFI
jgi:hypothetical protein